MATFKVLLAGGRAGGRIVDVEEGETSVEVTVQGIPTTGPDILPVCGPATVKQLYIQTDGHASGYPVWRWVP